HEPIVEPQVFPQLLPRLLDAVPPDDERRALDGAIAGVERPAYLERAAAVAGIEARQLVAGKQIADVHHAERAEEHPRVAVGVAASEVEQVDLVGTAEERQLPPEGARRQPAAADAHLLHPLLRVPLRDDVHVRRKLAVAADML